MMKSSFTTSQSMVVLKRAKSAVAVPALGQETGASTVKSACMHASLIPPMKELENAKPQGGG
jgi:hypothetical protein